jgi:hypothetical protein
MIRHRIVPALNGSVPAKIRIHNRRMNAFAINSDILGFVLLAQRRRDAEFLI